MLISGFLPIRYNGELLPNCDLKKAVFADRKRLYVGVAQQVVPSLEDTRTKSRSTRRGYGYSYMQVRPLPPAKIKRGADTMRKSNNIGLILRVVSALL